MKKYIIITLLFLLSGTFFNCSFSSAAEKWMESYETIHQEMKDKLDSKIKKNWIVEDYPDPDNDLNEYNIDEAFEAYQLPLDAFMIGIYKRTKSIEGVLNEKTFYQGNPPQPHYWLIPDSSPSGKYGEIYINQLDDKLSINGLVVYTSGLATYVKFSYTTLQEAINNSNLKDIEKVSVLICTNYKMSLVYAKDSSNQEWIIPYESEKITSTLKELGCEKGKAYTAQEFIDMMDATYWEYTVDEYLEKMENSSDLAFGTNNILDSGSRLKETSTTKDTISKNSKPSKNVIIAAITISVLFICIFLILIIKKRNKSKVSE